MDSVGKNQIERNQAAKKSVDTASNIRLVIRLSHIGDVVLLSGVLLWRYTEFNERFIIITSEGMAELFKDNPAVLEVKEFSKKTLSAKKLKALAQELYALYPYPLYDMHNNLRTKILSLFWRGKVHVYKKNTLARRLFLHTSFLSSRIRLKTLDKHVVERYALNFSENIPSVRALAPKIFLNDKEKSFAQDFLASRNKENKKVIVLHPFASYNGKVWAIEKWKELYEKLAVDYFPLFIGKGEEYSWIQPEHRAINIFSLRESTALIACSSYVITGDSAPLHLAMAVQTPVIALFGATTAEWGFFPLNEHDVLLQNRLKCTPCSLHGKKEACPHDYACINGISVEEVLNHIK